MCRFMQNGACRRAASTSESVKAWGGSLQSLIFSAGAAQGTGL